MRKIIIGKTHDEQMQAADIALQRLERRIQDKENQAIHVSPFILTGYIDTNSILAYIPINCTIDLVDVMVEKIEMPTPEEQKKPEAIMTVDILPLTGLGTSLNLKVKLGHGKANPQYAIKTPTRLTVKFNRPVQAWISLVAYPTQMKQAQIEEGSTEDAGILLPGI